MAITLAQSNYGIGSGGSTWNGTFTGSTTIGNTLFFAVFSYASGAAISASTPTYNGSAYASASQLIAECSTGGGNVFVAIWMFPNVSVSATTLGLTCTNGTVDGNVGWIAYEVSGLGTTPTLDQSTGAFASSGNTSSGATSAIQFTNEFVVGASVGYGVNQTAASGFTNLWDYQTSGFCEAGYQIVASSGGTYTYATNTGTSADWSAAVATVYAGGGNAIAWVV